MRNMISRLPKSAESNVSIISVTAIISLVDYLSDRLRRGERITENTYKSSIISVFVNVQLRLRAFSHVSDAGPTLNFYDVDLKSTRMHPRLAFIDSSVSSSIS